MKHLILVLAVLAAPAFGADKIGNGGGLWVCYSKGNTVVSASLVDLYEAVNEYSLTLIPDNVNDVYIVDSVEKTVQQNLPEYSHRWSAILSDVRTRIKFVNSELVVIEDALYHIKPLRSLCDTDWEYVQFANYTKQGQVLIRKDIWRDYRINGLDKAGLIWHEVIYRWMREEFDDQNSVRARRIVGVIFSTLSGTEMQAAINEILRPEVEPTPESPVWVCMIQNSHISKYYLDYGNDKITAQSRALSTCQLGGKEFFCDENSVQCESFTSQKQAYSCSNENSHISKVYSATGRSRLEAEAKARRACTQTDKSFFCATEVVCGN